jgi:DNA-binding transcriptional regulator YhcF (GntR family)
MARHTNGWVKIERRAALGDINSNFIRGGLFMALIAMANIQRSIVSWRGKPRNLVRGEIVTSFHELAEMGKVDVKTISKHLNYLALRKTIFIEKSSQGVLIKFLNFERYNSLDAEWSTQGPHAMEDGMDRGMDRGVHYNGELKNKRIKEATTEFFKNESILIQAIPEETHKRWASLYPDPKFIAREITKAWGYYCEDKIKPAPKNLAAWLKALSSWLDRGWPKHLEASQPSKETDWLIEADNYLTGVRQFGVHDGAKMRSFLGEKRWPIYLKIGRSRIANMPENEFVRRDLARLIEAISSEYALEREATA